MKKTIRKVLLVLLMTTVLSWCATTTNNTQQNEQDDTITNQPHGEALNIVTTFPPLYSFTLNLIDENDTVTNLVPAGTSVHTRQPRPSDIVAMEEADLIIINGLGLEEFLDNYLENLQDQGVMIVDTSKWIETIESDTKDNDHEEHEEDWHDNHDDEETEDHHEHSHEGQDPHIWLNPVLAAQQTTNISDALAQRDPRQAMFYRQQEETYKQKLKKLDTSIKTKINNTEQSKFIVFHDAYQYFLRQYNLTTYQVGQIKEFHGDNPSQKELAALIDIITKQWVQTIYTEPQFNPAIVKRLEEETIIKTQEIDPIGTEVGKDWYITMIETIAAWFSE